MHPLIATWITAYLTPAIESCTNQLALLPDIAPNRKNQLAALKHLKWVLTQDKFKPYFEDYIEYQTLYRPLLMSQVAEMLESAQSDVESEACDYTWEQNTQSIFDDVAHLMRANITLVSQFGDDIASEIKDAQ